MAYSIATNKMILVIIYILIASCNCASIVNTHLVDLLNQEPTDLNLQEKLDSEVI